MSSRNALSFVTQYIALVCRLALVFSRHIFSAFRFLYEFVWIDHSSKCLLLVTQLLLFLWFVIDWVYPFCTDKLFFMDDGLSFVAGANRLISDYISYEAAVCAPPSDTLSLLAQVCCAYLRQPPLLRLRHFGQSRTVFSRCSRFVRPCFLIELTSYVS